MLNSIITIVQKEIKDAIRDPGSVIAALLYAFIGPALVWTIIKILSSSVAGEIDKSIDINGVDQSSQIVRYLEEKGFSHKENSPVKVLFDTDIDKKIYDGTQVKIIIEADLADNGAVVEGLRKTLSSYSNLIVEKRLVSHDISLEYIHPLDINVENSQTTSFLGKSLISLMTLSFCMAIAFTGMSLSIDMTAGERERMTLEPLLAQPVSTLEIVAGKWMTALLMAMLGSAITATLLVFVFSGVKGPIIDIEFNFISALKVFIYLIPLCALFASIQIAVALFARSYKEGLTYLSLSGIGPMVVSFTNEDIAEKLNFLPLFWEAGAINNIISQDSTLILPNSALLISIMIISICLYYAQRRLNQEKILF